MSPSVVKREVVAGGTADIVVEFRDDNGNLTAVDGTPTVTITDSQGADDVSSANMTQEIIGRWVYFYSVPSTPRGVYKAVVSADADTTSGTRTEKQEVTFDVV